MLSKYEKTLLEGWEEIHKRGQLTLWILLALKDGPKHMNAIKTFIIIATANVISADDKSLYRALRRYNEADLIEFRTMPSKSGPELKIYQLTKTGRNVLREFLDRNMLGPLFAAPIQKLMIS